MATSKDKAKERELRRLKRENVREQEASARQREEFRAVQAQKENYEIMLRRKEEQLRQIKADVVSRFRLSRQSDSGKSLNQEDPVFSEGGEEASAEEEKHIYSDQSEAVSLKTVDASGIMYEASDDKESPLNVDKDQQGNSDFIKMMDSEIDKLDRQLTELRVQRESIKSIGVDDNSNEKKISKISSREAIDRLEKGKEFAGVRKKDTAYGIKEQSVILSPDTLKRKSRVEKEDKSDKYDGYDEKEVATDQFRYNQTDSEIEKARTYSPQRNRTIPTPMTYEKDSYPYTPQEDRQIKPEDSLQHAMQDFEERMMTKVLHELRLHNQQLFFEESIKMEQRMIAFEDASKLQMHKFLEEERKAMRLLYTDKEGQINSNYKIEIKQRDKEAEQPVVEPQEWKTKTDILTRKEEEIKRWEMELREREKWIQQQEDSLQEVGQLKESLIEQRDELNKRMALVNNKEEELMKGESSKEDNTQNNKVETKESLAKKPLNEDDSAHSKTNSELESDALQKQEKEQQHSQSKNTEIRQTILDSQYVFPKFSPFSGDDPKPKTEASFEEWKYEVECIRKEKEHSDVAITQAVRKSLRGQAKRVILPLGTSANIACLMERLENVFGNVASGQAILKEFYTATQKENESITSWGLRLEEIYQRAIEKGKAREEERDNTLKEQFWKSLRSERLKNATRVKFETIESFELLRRAVRAEENEMKVATNLQQQQLKQQKKEEEPKEDKLDMIIKRIEALEKGRNKGGWNANQTQNRQNNKQPYYGKNKNTKFDKKDEAPKQKTEPLN